MKQLFTLVILFLILLGGYLFIRQEIEPEKFQAPEELSLQNFRLDSFSGISLDFSGENKISLVKEGNGWLVNGFVADPAKIDQLLQSLDTAAITSLASTNPDNHGRFQVGEIAGLKMVVSFKDADEQTFIIGKSAGGQSLYLRHPDKNEVYVLDGLPRHTLNEDLTSWRDRAIANFKGEEIRVVKNAAGFQSYEMVINEGAWLLKRDRFADVTLDPQKVVPWMQSVAKLQAVSFPTEEEVGEVGNKQLRGVITIELGSDGSFTGKHVWNVYQAKDAAQLLIIREADQLGFLVYKTSYEAIFQTRADILERLLPGSEPALPAGGEATTPTSIPEPVFSTN